MKHKRGSDHNWDIRRYIGDVAYYAFCKCGWYYSCGSVLHKEKPFSLYCYCPNCGARKKWYNSDPRQMNKSILDLYERTPNEK